MGNQAGGALAATPLRSVSLPIAFAALCVGCGSRPSASGSGLSSIVGIIDRLSIRNGRRRAARPQHELQDSEDRVDGHGAAASRRSAKAWRRGIRTS